MDDTLSRVPNRANPGGEVRARWAWTEPHVWTDRMLSALETGVKGGRWFSLMDKVYSLANLEAAWRKVAANKGAAGVDHQTIAMVEADRERILNDLAHELRNGHYRPRAVRRVWIEKPGSSQKRPLGIPTVRDRIVQTAVRHVLEPIFERDFAEHSYGFRPGRGCKDALRRVDELLEAGYEYVVDADLQSYFDTIAHEQLMKQIERKVSDGRVLKLIEAFLKQDVMEGMQRWSPERGSPQGAIISPLLSNIYLDPLDQEMATGGYEMVRYADDLVVLCRSREEAERAMEVMQRWVAQARLRLHPEKTRIVEMSERGGFDFLGYHFERGRKWPRRKSKKKLKEAIRAKTPRTSGESLERTIAEVNPILRGWYEYFKHSLGNVFGEVDGWVRGRLRSILRKQQKQRGRGRGADHQRWPNAYFAERGLFSLKAAHAKERQSLAR
jgi:RNA-directed DNA polymerase